MKLILNRLWENEDATAGRLFLPIDEGAGVSRQAVFYTCEDERREVKVAGETRIPAGEYQIRLRREGGMVRRYDKRFAPFHDGMLWLQDVPNFEYVYIHVGNTDDDTEGCILVGMERGPGMTVRKSAVAYKMLYQEVWQAAESGLLAITINDPQEQAEN